MSVKYYRRFFSNSRTPLYCKSDLGVILDRDNNKLDLVERDLYLYSSEITEIDWILGENEPDEDYNYWFSNILIKDPFYP